MSVYTVVHREELEAFLRSFEVGRLRSYAGVTAGIENTNYFVSTTGGDFVLTIFEFTPVSELPYFLDLMAYLAEHGVTSPHPLADRSGRYLQRLKDKPAALVRRLAGESVTAPDAGHCAAIGAALAEMHLAAGAFPAFRENDRGPQWHASAARLVEPMLGAADRSLLREALSEQPGDTRRSVPEGVIHADLFRDNALFEGHELTGIVDFYYAHNGPFIYDLAVTVADWCLNPGEELALDAARALARAYDRVRRITDREREAWSYHVRAAGLRFWLSRLQDKYFPREGTLTHIKDPEPFKRVLLEGREPTAPINRLWT